MRTNRARWLNTPLRAVSNRHHSQHFRKFMRSLYCISTMSSWNSRNAQLHFWLPYDVCGIFDRKPPCLPGIKGQSARSSKYIFHSLHLHSAHISLSLASLPAISPSQYSSNFFVVNSRMSPTQETQTQTAPQGPLVNEEGSWYYGSSPSNGCVIA